MRLICSKCHPRKRHVYCMVAVNEAGTHLGNHFGIVMHKGKPHWLKWKNMQPVMLK